MHSTCLLHKVSEHKLWPQQDYQSPPYREKGSIFHDSQPPKKTNKQTNKQTKQNKLTNNNNNNKNLKKIKKK